jgi:hypothetical protein
MIRILRKTRSGTKPGTVQKHSTRFNQEQLVGVKWTWIRGLRDSQVLILAYS